MFGVSTSMFLLILRMICGFHFANVPIPLPADTHVVINDDVAPLVVLSVEEAHVVSSPRRLHVGLEHALDRSLVLREARDRAQEPAVAELALADVYVVVRQRGGRG